MPIYTLSAPETVHLLSGHILPRNPSNFTHSHLDFKTFPGEKLPDPLLTEAMKKREWERIKRFLPLKKGEGGKVQGMGQRDGRQEGGEGTTSNREGGNLAPRS